MRQFEEGSDLDIVAKTYELMYMEQTVEKIREYQELYQPGKHGRWTMTEILDRLSQVRDDSDPDTNLTQDIHAYQTGEKIKEMYFKNGQFVDFDILTVFENEDMPKMYQSCQFSEFYPNFDFGCLPLLGLIHDFGKVLTLSEFGSLPQHFVVGDTYPIEYTADINMPFYDIAQKYIHGNQSLDKQNIGFNNCLFSFSHDWYLSNILKNQSKLSADALYIINYHSFYPWVKPKFTRGYTTLASDYDYYMLPLLKLFQRSDLYSKCQIIPPISDLKSYYQNLISTYVPGRLHW